MSILDCTIAWITFPVVELILKTYSFMDSLPENSCVTLMIPDLYPAQALVDNDHDRLEASIEVTDHSRPIRGQY